MYIAPKIMVYTSDKNKFIENNGDYQDINNNFYKFGGVATNSSEIRAFIQNGIKIIYDTGIEEVKSYKSDDIQYTFEYIDKKDKLMLPIFFKVLIDIVSKDNTEIYTKYLYNNYARQNEKIKFLLESIISIPNIPIEILSKYYARLYTADSSFYKKMNRDLGQNCEENKKYLNFIKVLYEGVKLKSLPLANENVLYRAAKISKIEINKIKNFLNQEVEGIHKSIVFSKSFQSFTKDKIIADKFLNYEKNNDNNLSKVLFKLEKNENIEYSLATHGDISFYQNEKEVLFFPFSSFEIIKINDLDIGEEKGYEIEILYLGKYLKDIENDNNLINKENKIPDTIFKKQLYEFGFIDEKLIENLNTKSLYELYKKYSGKEEDEKEVEKKDKKIELKKEEKKKKNNNNFIVGDIYINYCDINKDIQIINTFENSEKTNNSISQEDLRKYRNEKEIKENIEIRINKKLIDFSYYYIFEKEGIYTIEYSFKNNLRNINNLFYDCCNLTNLNLTNFNTKYVNNMSYMFFNCKSLKHLNLSNFTTKNVTNMSHIFSGCKSLIEIDLSSFTTLNVNNMSNLFAECRSLINLNLSNFNTQNVNDMSNMFSGCKSLTDLNLSIFKTENVTNMSYMFSGCKSLTDLNLSNFETYNVTNMNNMFSYCNLLENLDLSTFKTPKVINMKEMFSNCTSLISLNISNFKTENVTDMNNELYAF